jgi:hypothetical protein
MLYKSWFAALIVVLLSACGGQHQTTEALRGIENQLTVQGSAPIAGDGVGQARQAAINDAIANASMRLRNSQSGSLTTSQVKVVDEWREGNTFHVQALVVLTKRVDCQSAYRKHFVATAFPIMNPDQVSGAESQDLFSGIPREIGNRLMESGDFIVRNMTGSGLYSRPDLAPEVNINGQFSNRTILDVAKREDAQFVLSGVIRDFKIESTEYVRGSGVFAELKSMMRDYIARRSIGVDVFVHDGFTGALLFQHRYTDTIIGDVSLPSGYTVGSERFNATSAGHKITQIIQMASEDIQDLFACYPFAARVVRVDNQRIYLAAGAQDRIRSGDRFKVYSGGFTGLPGMGFTDPIGIMVVSEVGPTMAAGRLEAEGQGLALVRPGDWVRSFSMP